MATTWEISMLHFQRLRPCLFINCRQELIKLKKWKQNYKQNSVQWISFMKEIFNEYPLLQFKYTLTKRIIVLNTKFIVTRWCYDQAQQHIASTVPKRCLSTNMYVYTNSGGNTSSLKGRSSMYNDVVYLPKGPCMYWTIRTNSKASYGKSIQYIAPSSLWISNLHT